MKILVFEGASSFCEVPPYRIGEGASPTKVLWRDAVAGCSVLKYGCGLGAVAGCSGCSDEALHERAWKGSCGLGVWRGALAGCSGGVLWRMLWRGALLHGGSLRNGLEQEPSKKPARGQTPKPTKNKHFHEENSPVLRAF